MDATNMTFESEYFDAIIDKGTLDALIVNIIIIFQLECKFFSVARIIQLQINY